MLRQQEITPATTDRGITVTQEGIGLRPGYVPTSASATPPSPLSASYSAEEIARAIASLEQERYLKESAQSDGTQIADVLEQLNIDLPAAQVQARIEQERAVHIQQSKVRRATIAAILSLVIPLLALVVFAGMGVPSRGTAVTAGSNVTNVTQAQRIVPLSEMVVTDTSSGTPVRKTLAEVPEGKRVSMSAIQLKPLLGAQNIPYTTVVPTTSWKVFRKGNDVYLSAFTDAVQSRNALQVADTVLLQNIPTRGMGMDVSVPVSVPVDAILVRDDNSNPPYHMLRAQLKDIDRVTFGK